MSIWEKLAEPFNPETVHFRVGATNADKTKGMALAYVDARDVMDRLDEVCGPDGWQSEFSPVNGAVCCKIGIADTGHSGGKKELIDHSKVVWIWKSDGAGQTSYEGEKGQFSDAFKRAAVQHGIGRYLYSAGTPWVGIQKQGKSYKFDDITLARLRHNLGGKPVKEEDVPIKSAEELKADILDAIWVTKYITDYEKAWMDCKPFLDILKQLSPEMYDETRKECAKHAQKLKKVEEAAS